MRIVEAIREYGPLASIAGAIVAVVGLDLYIALASGEGGDGLSRAAMLLTLIITS
jgi:hypothetical protein